MTLSFWQGVPPPGEGSATSGVQEDLLNEQHQRLGVPWGMPTSDPDALFVQGAAQNRAKAVCMACPVRTECLADALDNRIEFGVWGGMTERERRALLRRRPNVASWRRLLETARAEHERMLEASAPATSAATVAPSRLRPARRVPPGPRRGRAAAGVGPSLSSSARSAPIRAARRGRARPAPAPAPRPPGPAGTRAVNRAAQRTLPLVRAASGRRASAAAPATSPCVAPRLLEVLGRGQRPRRPTAPRAGPVCTRLSTSPASGIRSRGEPLDEVRGLAQRVRLGRGDHQERRPRRLEQLVGRVGALAEAAEHGVERGDEGLHVLEDLRAQQLGEHAGDAARPPADDHSQVGAAAGLRGRRTSIRMSRPSRNEPSRAGASRKSSADRLGGVSTTMRSQPSGSASASARSWPSFSIAMYSCVPAKELDSAW